MIEFSDFALEHPSDYNYDDEYDYSDGDESENDEASKCSFDILTIEEYDNGGTLVQTKKHCETMPKKMNTTNVVLVKFVHFTNSFFNSPFISFEIGFSVKHIIFELAFVDLSRIIVTQNVVFTSNIWSKDVEAF